MISTLLGPLQKPIFEILYRSAYRAVFQLEPDLFIQPFTQRVIKLARSEKLKIERVDEERDLFLVEDLVWLKIIAADQDLQAVRAAALSSLLYVNHVKGEFILICGSPPRWSWAQVSQGARMNAQASMQTPPASERNPLELPTSQVPNG